MSRIIPIFMIFLMLHLQGCAATVYRWSEVPPERDTLSLSEREEAVERLKIRDFSGFSLANGNVILADEKPYSLNAFTPMILKISPSSEKNLQDLEFNDQLMGWLSASPWLLLLSHALVATIIGRIAPETVTDETNTTVGRIVILEWLLVGAAMVFVYYRDPDLKKNLQETYNADLKRYYLPETSSIEQVVPAPSLELIEKTVQAGSIP